jgi:hypothetical protein
MKMSGKLVVDLKVKLTEEELREKGQQMASKVIQYNEYEAEKKEIASDLGAKMKDLHAELTVLAKATRSQEETRPVECEVLFDVPEVGTKRIVKKDTMEVLKELAMTAEERQTELFSEADLKKLFDMPSDEEKGDEPEQ